jgi:hypothetical protein
MHCHRFYAFYVLIIFSQEYRSWALTTLSHTMLQKLSLNDWVSYETNRAICQSCHHCVQQCNLDTRGVAGCYVVSIRKRKLDFAKLHCKDASLP